MTGWLDRVDDLLCDGEYVFERVSVGAGSVVVTNHRVLAFSPERDGENFRAIDRPNVAGIDTETSGDDRFLFPAIKAVGVGLVLLIAGQVISLDSLVGDVALGGGATAQLGLGGIMGTLQTFLNLITMLDEIMTLVGGLALVLGVTILAVYALSREDRLVISVAGGDDFRLSAPDDAEGIAQQLERVVLPDGVSD